MRKAAIVTLVMLFGIYLGATAMAAETAT